MVFDCGPCPYLPDRRFHAFHPLDQDAIPYRRLMDFGFRRSGDQFYRPLCPGCTACQPLRVDAAAFAPRREQRRNQARNADLRVTYEPRGDDAERRALIARYVADVHGRSDDGMSFVDDAGVPGGELHARDGSGRLLAVSVVDRFADALSSVYCYWDPEERARRLGTFMVLAELAYCRAHRLPWLYLGFLVRECQAMAYKARYFPHEIHDGTRWRRVLAPA